MTKIKNSLNCNTEETFGKEDQQKCIKEINCLELLSKRVMNRATQTMGGDNQFIVQLRVQDKIREGENVISVRSELSDAMKLALKGKFKNLKSGIKRS